MKPHSTPITYDYLENLDDVEEIDYYININKMTKGALTIAECICPKLEKHLKWSNEKWFMFYKKTNLWMETKEPSYIIVQMIHKHIDYSIQIKINERTKTEDAEQQKAITDEIAKYSLNLYPYWLPVVRTKPWLFPLF